MQQQYATVEAHNVSLSQEERIGIRPLLSAVDRCDFDRALRQLSSNVTLSSSAKNYCFVLAVVRRCFNVAAELLSAGADPNAASDGYTALWILLLDTTDAKRSCSSDEIDFGRVMLNYGARSDMRALTHHSVLAECVHRRNVPALELLLQYQTNVNALDAQGRTPLFGAVANNDIEMARLLLERGATVHVLAHDALSVLHMAALHSVDLALVKLLLKAGANRRLLWFSPSLPSRHALTPHGIASRVATSKHLRSALVVPD